MATEYFNDAWRIPNNKNQSLVSNYSMEFDASSGDTIQLNNAGNSLFNNATAFTISAWINPLDTGTIQNILTNYGNAVAKQNVMLRWSITESLQFYVVTTSGVKLLPTANNLIQYNQWQHIVATYDGINSKVYYNGTLSNSMAATGVVTTSTEQDQIGWRAPYGQYFNGKMDQVCVFDYALPATGTNSVATLYGGGTAVTNPMGLSPAPVAYYQLGDQTASNNTTEPTPPVQSYLVPNNSLQDYVFNFDGSDDRITTDFNFPLLTTNFSFSVWIKPESTTTANVFIANNDSASDGYNSFIASNNIYFRLNGSDVISSISGLANTWIHVIATYDGSTQKLYINNNTPSTKSFSTSLSVDSATVIGARYDIAAFFNGSISNVSLYNTTLTDLQVATLYNNGSPATDISSLNPVSWYKLNAQDTFDGTNWTIKDYAGSNDGTSVGMTSANLVQSNLQHTSGYSPYALDFDGINDSLDCGTSQLLDFNSSFTISAWVYMTSVSGFNAVYAFKSAANSFVMFINNVSGYSSISFGSADGGGTNKTIKCTTNINLNQWNNIVVSYNGNGITTASNYNFYIDNSLKTLNNSNGFSNFGNVNKIGVYNVANSFSGKISNISIFNAQLTSNQVTEIYNQGVPSNLNTFSGTAPIAWWQLGSNSSFNATTSQWTCLDEIGTNNGVSDNSMAEDDIVNGVGYSGNGLGTSSIEIIGDAPYSTANGISENMDVLDRTTDVPPTV